MSIDTLACQTDIAQTIAEGNGWSLLIVKDNPSGLYAHLQRAFVTWTPVPARPTTGARPWNGGASGAFARS